LFVPLPPTYHIPVDTRPWESQRPKIAAQILNPFSLLKACTFTL
jgi:hypothetical protein